MCASGCLWLGGRSRLTFAVGAPLRLLFVRAPECSIRPSLPALWAFDQQSQELSSLFRAFVGRACGHFALDSLSHRKSFGPEKRRRNKSSESWPLASDRGLPFDSIVAGGRAFRGGPPCSMLPPTMRAACCNAARELEPHRSCSNQKTSSFGERTVSGAATDRVGRKCARLSTQAVTSAAELLDLDDDGRCVACTPCNKTKARLSARRWDQRQRQRTFPSSQ